MLLFRGVMIAGLCEVWFLGVQGKVWGVGVEDVGGDGIPLLLVFAEDSMCRCAYVLVSFCISP